MTHRLEKGQAKPEECERLLSPEQLAYNLNRRNCVGLSLMEGRRGDFEVTGQYALTVKSVSPYNNQFPMLVKDLRHWKKAGYRVILLSASRTPGGSAGP